MLDFVNVDQTIQVHGRYQPSLPYFLAYEQITDYEGVGLSSRDANSKAAASEATTIFANHYPELLVSANENRCCRC